MKTKHDEISLHGVPMSSGIAIGTPYFFFVKDEKITERTITSDQIENEVKRYRMALEQSRNDVKRLQKQLETENALEAAAILETHLQIMQDPLLTTMIENEIRETCKSADSVFHNCHIKYQKKFYSIRDPFFRERDKDLEDISRRIIGYLTESDLVTLASIPKNSIVFAKELTASDAAEAKAGNVIAFVTEAGGVNSHAAIVARAKGIPYVAKIKLDKLDHAASELAVVDGRTGDIILNPSSKSLTKYHQLQKKLKDHMETLEKSGGLDAETFDGYRMQLSANLETISELDLLHQYKACGVGLFRSEYIFLSKQTLPLEDEQFEIYKKIVEKMNGLPIVIRTFDIGGDKQSLSQKKVKESNPYLGLKTIRFLLNEPDIFKTQLRAILRASAYGDVSIMFPMISSLSEIIQAKSYVRSIQEELDDNKQLYKKSIKIGCMIEVPSAAIIADLLAKECDFLSIGTNDLIQYALAADRSSHEGSGVYTPMHPGIIRMIKLIVTLAHKHNKPVSVCGEMAADPLLTALLMGLGVDELSVASCHLPLVKHAIRNTSIISAVQLAEKVLTLTTTAEIQELLNEEYKRTTPQDFLHNLVISS